MVHVVQRVSMTEEEWIGLCDRSTNPATHTAFCEDLPVCCGICSDFRDAIIELHGRCGVMSSRLKAELLEKFRIFKERHDLEPASEWTVLEKLMSQVSELSPGI